MRTIAACGLALLAILLGGATPAAEPRSDDPLAGARKERLVLDDMTDVSTWYNGSPAETKLSIIKESAQPGGSALLFANVVDHTKGEKNYPIGWPRTGRRFDKSGLTDWSDYDFFECSIGADTSRQNLPGTPLGLGFSHPGHKHRTSFPLKQVKKGQVARIVIPIAQLDSPEVRSLQFNISESNYKHGDRVVFYISEMVLTRLVDPTIVGLAVDRQVLYSTDRQITALYTLMGDRRHPDLKVRFAIGPFAGPAVASITAEVSPLGELPLPVAGPLEPGEYEGKLTLIAADGKPLGKRSVPFRVVMGPF